jgi:hypothetical protein
MGAFFSSIQVRSEDRDAVKAAVESVAKESKQMFLLGPPLDGWIAVYLDDSGQGNQCATTLAKQLNTIVLSLMVHDDDIFFYNFFRNGELLNEYSSNPDYFEEVSAEEHKRLKARPDLFRELVSSPEKLAELSRLLDRDGHAVKFDFEHERLERFAALLGIQNTLTSYEYLTHGEHDGIKGWKLFIHIPDQSAEKAAAAALAAEKKRLHQEGLFCVEYLPPGKKQQRINARGEFCFDPVGGGLLVLWNTFIGKLQPPQLIYLQSPWISEPQPIELTFSSPMPGHLIMSTTGKWLAFSDTKLRLWDWRHRQLVDDIRADGVPVSFSRDEKLLLCQSQQKFDLVSLETRQVVQTFQTTSHVQALHPSNKFLITRPYQDKLGIVNLETGKLEKVLLSGKKMDCSHLAPVFEGTLKQAGVGGKDLAEWKASFVRGSDEILNLRFSPDGRLLFCATTVGLRVLAWDELINATETTPKPLFAITPLPDAESSVLDHHHYANFIYDVILDESQSRLLFCGIEGAIRFLNLKDRSSGILLDPPGKSPISRLQLSPDREFVCCLCGPLSEERNKQPWRIQVWNYPALCKAAGLTDS